jgi:Rieske Fe-S protein
MTEETGRPDFKALALSALGCLTATDRVGVIHNFCVHCGCQQPWHPLLKDIKKYDGGGGCQCWNDE